MWRFNLIVFALLGAAFYHLSGGADYAPRDASLQASGWTLLRAPQVSETRLTAAPVTLAEPAAMVSRAAVSLDTLAPAGTMRGAQLPIIAAVATGPAARFETVVQKDPEPEPGIVLPGLTEIIAAAATRSVDGRGDASAPDDIRRVRSARVNLRNGPGTSFDVVDKLVQGTELRVIGSEGDWLKTRVADSGRIGWVAANLLSAAN